MDFTGLMMCWIGPVAFAVAEADDDGDSEPSQEDRAQNQLCYRPLEEVRCCQRCVWVLATASWLCVRRSTLALDHVS